MSVPRSIEAPSSRIPSESWRLELVDLAARQKREDETLVAPEQSAVLVLASQFVAQILDTSKEQLRAGRNLPAVWSWARKPDESIDDHFRDALADDQVVVALLAGALQTESTLPLGDAVSTDHHTLPWDTLAELMGSDLLVARVRDVHSKKAALDLSDREDIAVDLALRHADGWRPTEREWN